MQSNWDCKGSALQRIPLLQQNWSPEDTELLQAVQSLAQKAGLVLKNSNGKLCGRACWMPLWLV